MLLNSDKRLSRVICKTNCTILQLNKKDFFEFISKSVLENLKEQVFKFSRNFMVGEIAKYLKDKKDHTESL